MIVCISPSKKLDATSAAPTKKKSNPTLLDNSELLIEQLKTMSVGDIQKLMGVSEKIAQLNEGRFQSWSTPFTHDNAKQAIFTFKGDVYEGLDGESLHNDDLQYAQKHLRILSGLYGLLKPLDLMQPYRLEMGTKLQNTKGKNLYEFWNNTITLTMNKALAAAKSDTLINLASNEYFSAIKPKELKADIITPIFKDWKNDRYKIISFYAKKARGLMARYIIENRLESTNYIKKFSEAGYTYNKEMSTDKQWVFTRRID